MTRRDRSAVWIAGLAAVLAVAGCSPRAGNPLRVATGYVSHVLCSEVFVSGRDPAAAYAESVAANPSFRPVDWALRHEVERDRRRVAARILGMFESEAVYRDGLGCVNAIGVESSAAAAGVAAGADSRGAALLPDIAPPTPVEASDARLRRAIDAAFEEPAAPPRRWTHAVVVVHDGRIVGERYAPGYGVTTPVHGWSATKSVTSALIGILVRQGRLDVHRPAPVAAWRAPGDGRGAITLDHLLRMTSGLAMGNSLTPSFSSAWDPAARMLFTEPDMAGFAEAAALSAAPGAEWTYTDGNTAILGRIIRDAVGGAAADVGRFARRELFDPLGMSGVTLELDGTGSPIGAVFMYAPPRAWARLGLLALGDGVVGGTRILPEGWVRYSATPTPGASVGYGAGWWTNQGDSAGARFRVRNGMPEDALFAAGANGQFVVAVPSTRLVVARFGATYDPRLAIRDIMRLTAEAVAALGGKVIEGGLDGPLRASPRSRIAPAEPALERGTSDARRAVSHSRSSFRQAVSSHYA